MTRRSIAGALSFLILGLSSADVRAQIAHGEILSDVQKKAAECRENFAVSAEFAGCAQTCFGSLRTLQSLSGKAMEEPWTRCVAAHRVAVQSGLQGEQPSTAGAAPATPSHAPAAGYNAAVDAQAAATSLEEKKRAGLQAAAALGVPDEVRDAAKAQQEYCEAGAQTQAFYDCECLPDALIADWRKERDRQLLQFYETSWADERRRIDQIREIGVNPAAADNREKRLENSENLAMRGENIRAPLSPSCLSRERIQAYAMSQCEYGNLPYGYNGTKAQYCSCYTGAYTEYVLDSISEGSSAGFSESSQYATLKCRP